MAKITLTVLDIDIEADTYRVDFNAEGSQLDEGRATAAYFAGFYLFTILNTADFVIGCTDFRRRLVEGMCKDGKFPETTKLAVGYVVIEDDDDGSGRIYPSLTFSGGDPTGNSLPTVAQCVAGYLRSLISNQQFNDAVWAFAEEYTAKNGGTIDNADHAPGFNEEVSQSAA